MHKIGSKCRAYQSMTSLAMRKEADLHARLLAVLRGAGWAVVHVSHDESRRLADARWHGARLHGLCQKFDFSNARESNAKSIAQVTAKQVTSCGPNDEMHEPSTDRSE